MTQVVSEYDQRQYQLMANRLNSFEKHKITLRCLISDLEGLLGVLQACDKAWKEAFEREWGTLEDVYSIALYRGKTVLLPEDEKLVGEAIQRMKQLLKRKLQIL